MTLKSQWPDHNVADVNLNVQRLLSDRLSDTLDSHAGQIQSRFRALEKDICRDTENRRKQIDKLKANAEYAVEMISTVRQVAGWLEDESRKVLQGLSGDSDSD